MENNESFSYAYSAKQQEELKAIRDKYLPKDEDKMERLRRLDASATRPGTTAALVMGIVGCLILGIGMSCCMVWASLESVTGIIIGAVGIILGVIGLIDIALAYPLYKKITAKQREIIAPEILRLTEELMK